MALPAKKRPKSEKRNRLFAHRLVAPGLIACSHCKKLIPPHRVCPHCGYLGGRQVVIVRSRTEKKKQREQRQKDKGK